MYKFAVPFAVAVLACPAAFAATPAEILAANKAAMGGSAWDSKVTLKLDYAYSGQGLTGTTSSLEDLKRGAFVDSYDIPPTSGASGWDGDKAWEKEQSGTVTGQAGGDVIPLAITEAYQDRNLWWQPDYGGAQIASAGQKSDGAKTYDVLTVTPANGTPFDAWFDPQSHLLYRTIEPNGTQTITTTYSDYAPVEGAMIPKKLVVDDGSHNLQTFTLTAAKFSAPMPASAYAKPAENLHDFFIAGGAHETTAPFRLLNNHIYAQVSVNGSKPITFILDTGGHSVLMPATAKALGVTSKGNLTATGAGDQISTGGIAMVKSLRLGGATLTNQPVSVQVLSPPGVEGAHEQGMIGYEFFARFITRFDYGNHTVTFIDKKYFNPKDAGTPVHMRLYHQFPEILGSYDGVPGRFGIDTGSRMALLLNKAWAAKNGFPKPGTKTIEAQTGWGIGGPTHSLVFRGGTLKLGDVTIDHPLTMVSTDKGGAGSAEAFPSNIGGGVLKRFAVTFDYDNSTMYMKPVKGPVADLDTFDKSGMWINAVPEGFRVFDVTAGGPAEAAGVQKGDIISAIDGKPAAGFELPKLREAWRTEKSGTVVKLTLKRGAGTKQLALTLRDLI